MKNFFVLKCILDVRNALGEYMNEKKAMIFLKKCILKILKLYKMQKTISCKKFFNKAKKDKKCRFFYRCPRIIYNFVIILSFFLFMFEPSQEKEKIFKQHT